MKGFVPPLLIVLIAAALFGPIVGHDFTNLDDQQTIAQNSDLRPPTLKSLKHMWSAEAAGLYVPVTYTMWWLIAQVSFDGVAMRAWPFHLASVALHASNGLLIWLILRRLQFKPLPSLLGAILFVVHPVQVETVAWASGLKDQLAAFFSLAAIAVYFRNTSPSPCTRGEGGGEGPPGISFNQAAKTKVQDPLPSPFPEYKEREAAVWALIALAMLAKPSAIMTPLFIAAIDLIYSRRPIRCTLRALWPVIFAIIPIVIIARSVQTIWPAVLTPLWQRPLIAGDALAFYATKLLWPATLTHLYGRTPMLVTSSPALYWVWLLPMFIALIVLSQWRHRRGVVAGAVIFTLALLPVLGFTPFEFQIHSTVADHYLYLPMLGVAVMFASQFSPRGSTELAEAPTLNAQRPAVISSIILLLILAARSAFQLPVWSNSLTLNTHAVAVRPQSVDAHGSLAIALAEAGQVQPAIPHLQFVVAKVPTNRMGHLRLAQAYLALGDFPHALPEAAAAVQYTSGAERDPLPNLYLADALIGLGRRDQAAAALEAAWRIDPTNDTVQRRMQSLTNLSTTATSDR